jgi:hypothetical protein
MRFRYLKPTRRGNPYEVSESVETFAVSMLLAEDPAATVERPIRLEKQGEKIAAALGRLLDLLAQKGILSGPEIHAVLETDQRFSEAELTPEQQP